MICTKRAEENFGNGDINYLIHFFEYMCKKDFTLSFCVTSIENYVNRSRALPLLYYTIHFSQ